MNKDVIEADARGYRGCNTWIDRDKLKRLYIKSDNPNFKCKYCDGNSKECEEILGSRSFFISNFESNRAQIKDNYGTYSLTNTLAYTLYS